MAQRDTGRDVAENNPVYMVAAAIGIIRRRADVEARFRHRVG